MKNKVILANNYFIFLVDFLILEDNINKCYTKVDMVEH